MRQHDARQLAQDAKIGRTVEASSCFLKQRSVQSDTKRGSRSRQCPHDNFGFRAVVGAAVARPVHHHHLLLLAAAKCNCGVTLASYHTMLHHRKRGFAILSTEWARRAESRLGLAHTHPHKERLHDVQRRLLQHGTTLPLLSQPGRSHKDGSPRFLRRFGILAALTSNEEALSAFLLA